MRIIISVAGKFHAFHLAEQLDKRGLLQKLITTYFSPNRNARDISIDPGRVVTNRLPEVVMRLPQKIPILRDYFEWAWYKNRMFERWAETQVEKCDIFVGWSGFSLKPLLKAKSLGAFTVLERGSSHAAFQQGIMKEEYQSFGLSPKGLDNRYLEQELKEYEATDYICIPSSFVKKTFLQQGVPEDKLIHVPFGVNLSSFKQIPKEDNIFKVVFCGGMMLRKGVYYLLKAFKELKLPNSELLLIGGMAREMKSLFNEYNGWYRHIGPFPQVELYKYYSQGSVFVMPSIEEGLALVIPQAMACGLPVICTTNTGGEDIVRDGKDGFMIPTHDIEVLKEKILFMYEHPETCREMGQSAKRRVSEGFTWDDYGEKMVHEYMRILSQTKGDVSYK